MTVAQRLENLFPARAGAKPRLLRPALLILLVAAVFGGRIRDAAAEPVGTAGAIGRSGPLLPAPPPTIPPNPIESRTNALKPPALRRIAPGVFGLGEIRLDQRQRTVAFPAVLNLIEGPLEYLLVTGYGKKHESLLCTEVPPFNLHVAMLLLDAAAPTNQAAAPPPAYIANPSGTPIAGTRIGIELSWQRGEGPRHCTAEQALFNRQSGAELPAGAWIYNGSAVWDGRFLAQRDGSIACLVTDLAALINNNGPGHDNDHIWRANAATLPPVGTPVTVTIRLLNAPAPLKTSAAAASSF